jgi:hypothetical protein
MRINYNDDEDTPGQFALWRANCQRSLHGRKGQAALRALEAALVALPSKRLVAHEFDNGTDVCAIGALARAKGHTPKADPEYEMEEIGVELGMPRLVAWLIVELNDILLDTVWEVGDGPQRPHCGLYKGGIPLIRDMTPEERYEKVLTWVRREIR